MPEIRGVTYPADPPGPHLEMPLVEMEIKPYREVVKKPKVAPPRIRSEVIGHSVKKQEITLHVFGDEKNPVTFIFAGIHGEEATTATTADYLVELLRKNRDLYKNRCVAVIPRANPDGLDANRRVNENGVDLNRNFPAHNFKASARHGKFPSSEPETRALIKAINLFEPVRIMSIHSCRRGRHGNNWDGPAKKIADAMARYNGYRSFGTWHNPTPGSFGNWAGIDLKIPTVTLELPNDLSSDACWTKNREAILEFIRSAPVGK